VSVIVSGFSVIVVNVI